MRPPVRHAQVVLIAAGSLGARAINDAIFGALPRLLDRTIVLHMTGAGDEATAVEARSAPLTGAAGALSRPRLHR